MSVENSFLRRFALNDCAPFYLGGSTPSSLLHILNQTYNCEKNCLVLPSSKSTVDLVGPFTQKWYIPMVLFLAFLDSDLD